MFWLITINKIIFNYNVIITIFIKWFRSRDLSYFDDEGVSALGSKITWDEKNISLENLISKIKNIAVTDKSFNNKYDILMDRFGSEEVKNDIEKIIFMNIISRLQEDNTFKKNCIKYIRDENDMSNIFFNLKENSDESKLLWLKIVYNKIYSSYPIFYIYILLSILLFSIGSILYWKRNI